MNGTLVFDVPLRLFHWMLVAHFLAAFVVATVAGQASVAFAMHAMLGMILVLLVLLRIVWGFIGTRWARFAALDLRPSALGRYLTAVVSGGSGMDRAGHNPATAWYMTLVLPLLLGVGITGLLTARGDARFAALHQALAWTVLGLAAVHVLGVLWHVARTGENLVASMVDGRRQVVHEHAIASARPLVGLLLIALAGAFAILLFSHLDLANRRLTVFGTSLTIGQVRGEQAGR